MTATYTVWMVNFNIDKGTFTTLDEAVAHAKKLGFECAIWRKEPDKEYELVRTVKPW